MTRTSFRTLLARPRPLVTPMAHDALSARMITDAGFEALGLSGSSLLAAQFALPDIGLSGMVEMLEGGLQIMRGTHLPWGADADDGFGGVNNVIHTVRSFAAVGCGQLVIEDQLRVTKRPGDGGAQTLVTAADMQAKLAAALSARGEADMMIIARTDAYGCEGMDAALRRAEAYLAVGADGIFVAGLETPEQLRQVGAALKGALLVAVVGERRIRDWPSPEELYQMGFAQITYPGMLITRVCAALRSGLVDLRDLATGRRLAPEMPNFEADLDALSRHLRLQEWLNSGRTFDSK